MGDCLQRNPPKCYMGDTASAGLSTSGACGINPKGRALQQIPREKDCSMLALAYGSAGWPYTTVPRERSDLS